MGVLEDIKKEIKALEHTTNELRILGLDINIDYVSLGRVLEILDKHNNQEKVSNESENILLNNFHREHTRATKFQSAWEELKFTCECTLKNDNSLSKEHNKDFAKSLLFNMKELSKKHNLEKE